MEIISSKTFSKEAGFVPFYDNAPDGDINVQQLEQWSFDRLLVLRKIDSLITMGKKGEELSNQIKDYEKLYIPIKGNDPELRKKDDVSHHILRLAFHNE